MLFEFLFRRYFVAQPETKLVLSASSFDLLERHTVKKQILNRAILSPTAKMGTPPEKSIDIDIWFAFTRKALEFYPTLGYSIRPVVYPSDPSSLMCESRTPVYPPCKCSELMLNVSIESTQHRC